MLLSWLLNSVSSLAYKSLYLAFYLTRNTELSWTDRAASMARQVFQPSSHTLEYFWGSCMEYPHVLAFRSVINTVCPRYLCFALLFNGPVRTTAVSLRGPIKWVAHHCCFLPAIYRHGLLETSCGCQAEARVADLIG